MPLRTYLSFVITNWDFAQKVFRLKDNLSINCGYIGRSGVQYLEFIHSHSMQRHILFAEANIQLFELMSAQDEICPQKVYTVLLGRSLDRAQIPFIIQNGISGFISEIPHDEFFFKRLINQILRKGFFANEFIPESHWKIEKHQKKEIENPPILTNRQQEILTYLCNGKTGVEIAGLICRSEATVRKAFEGLRSKFEVHSNQELIIICLSNGWVHVRDK